MATEEYPIVCWKIKEDVILGKVLGTGITVVESDIKKVKRNASDSIIKLLKDGMHYINPPDIIEPQVHLHKVDLQLSYREKDGTFPLSQRTQIKIAAVYGGVADSGFGECFLPYLDQEFYYYNQEQRTTLIKHFTREFMQNLAPEVAYHYIMPSNPWVETIKVRLPDEKQSRVNKKHFPEILQDTADHLPEIKKLRRVTTRMPEMVFERSSEIQQLAKMLEEGNSNCLIVGDQGIGKSSMITEAIKTASKTTISKVIEENEEPPSFWRTTSQRMTGKAKYLGEWQQICDELVEALGSCNGMLWISDFISLFNTGGEAQEDSIAAYLQSYIQKGQLKLTGEMRPQELEIARSLLPGFIHLFKIIKIDELSNEKSRRVLNQYTQYASTNFDINTQPEAADLCYQLSNRYLKYEKRPGNIVRFYSLCLKHAAINNQTVIDRQYIIDRFAHHTGLPENILRDDIPLSEQQLSDFFSDRIKGQDHIIKQLCTIVQTFKAGLNDPNRPIATLLFAGPTGVGKTAATKALAEFFFSSGQKKNPLFTLDMSEFQHPGQVDRLIGSPSSPGKLVSHVRNQPFSVILLDEIEKADSSVFDLLLTVLDEGILTDRHGRLTDFRSSIIIMTSNLGAKTANTLGFLNTNEQDTSLNAVRNHFRPEFFNRIDMVLNFNALNKSAIKLIVKRELDLLHQRDRIKQKNITLTFSNEVIKFIAEAGFSKQYGARPIQRAIEKYIVSKLASYFMENPVKQQLAIDVKDKQIEISS